MPTIEFDFDETHQRVEIQVAFPGQPPQSIEADTATVDQLISVLGAARSQMTPPVSHDTPPGERPLDGFDPRWRITSDTTNRFAVIWIRHPGLGWSAYGIPRIEAANIATVLRTVSTNCARREGRSSTATSVDLNHSLLTTEGFGYYYYGKGERKIGPNPFEQMEFDSDRAAGIVGGSIVEKRLEQALKSRLRDEKPQLLQEMFRPSGPLGPFSVKINLAFLQSFLTETAYKDLSTLKSIRNDFAHDLELDSFEIPTIRDRCSNLRVVNKHVGPVPSPDDPSPRSDFYLGLPNHEEKLSNPRFRYVMTAMIIGNALGEAADQTEKNPPFI